MHKVTEEQIEFILDDIESRGVVLEDLQDNILDHMCCIIENELNEGEDFNSFYELLLPRFFKEELSEIQIETDNLIRFKNFYSMKRVLKISGIATALFTTFGAIFKTMHWPGAGIMIVLGGFFFSFIFLPLLIALKFRDEESSTDKAVFSLGFILAMILSVGLIFKLMHWPFATNLLRYSSLVFTFVYVPLYFFTRFKRPELKFNTIVNSVLMIACGGIFYSLFDLSYSKKYEDQMMSDHWYMHNNSVRLFASNDLLLSEDLKNSESMKLMAVSKAVNERIEDIALIIVQEKSTKSAMRIVPELQRSIEEYNKAAALINIEEVLEIDPDGIESIDRFSLELAMNLLTRIQQQLAVNETCYLSSLIAVK